MQLYIYEIVLKVKVKAQVCLFFICKINSSFFSWVGDCSQCRRITCVPRHPGRSSLDTREEKTSRLRKR